MFNARIFCLVSGLCIFVLYFYVSLYLYFLDSSLDSFKYFWTLLDNLDTFGQFGTVLDTLDIVGSVTNCSMLDFLVWYLVFLLLYFYVTLFLYFLDNSRHSGHFGVLLDSLDLFEHFWTLMYSFGQFWTVLDTFGQFWTLLDSFGYFGHF